MAIVLFKFANYLFTDKIEEWKTKDKPILDLGAVPRSHGSIINGGRIGSKIITIKGSLEASTALLLRDKLNALKVGIFNITGNLTKFDDRFIECRLQSYSDDYNEGTALTSLNFTASFISTVPFWKSANLNSSNVTTTTSGNTDIVITNNGNFETPIRITVTGATLISDISVENITTGKSLSYTGLLSTSNSVVISGLVVPPIVENDGTNDITNFSGSFLMLQPGTNTIRLVTDIGAVLLLEHRDYWL